MIKVSYIKSDDRIYNIERCLALIKSEITLGLKNATRIVVKPCCPVANNQLAATHVEALFAVINFIQPFVKSQITLAGNTGLDDTMTAFKNYGYFDLQDKFDLAIVDLNTDEFEEVELSSTDTSKFSVKIANTLTQSDYIISIAPPKTDNLVNFAGSIKNVVPDLQFHQSNNSFWDRIFSSDKNPSSNDGKELKLIHENILKLYQKIPLKLSVLDGFEVMAGDGPVDGEMVAAHFAIAGTNPTAVDWLACKCLGIPVDAVGYLSLLEQKENMNYFVAGDEWQKHVLDIKMPQNYDKNRQWQ